MKRGRLAGPAAIRSFGDARRRLLQHALFLVELLGARMERNAGARRRQRRHDRLALGVARVELLARVVVPHRLRDLVDQRVGLLGRRHPLRADGDRLDGVHALVRIGRNGVGREEPILLQHLVDLGARDRHELDAAARRGELGDRAGRIAADEEERVEAAVLHLVAGLVGLQVLGLDVLFGDPVGRENDPRIDQRARARLVERHALALEIGDALDAGALARDDMDGLGIEIRDEAKVSDLRLAFVDARARVGPEGDVGLREARFHLAGRDAVDVRDRPVRRDGGRDQPRDAAAAAVGAGARAGRIGDRVGDEAADRVVGAGGAAGADAEELDVLGERCGNRDGGQRGGGECAHRGAGEKT